MWEYITTVLMLFLLAFGIIMLFAVALIVYETVRLVRLERMRRDYSNWLMEFRVRSWL